MRDRARETWVFESAPVLRAVLTLAVPTVAMLMGFYGPAPTLGQARPALVAGALLGVAHLLLRPVLRLITAPLGCMTLGLFGMVIDVALLYFCCGLVEGFAIPGPLYAVLTAALINVICDVAAGRH